MRWGIRRISRSSIIYILGDLLAKGSALFLIPIYVRFLTQAEIGLLALLGAVIAVLRAVFALGLGAAVTRFYQEFEGDRQADAYTASLWWVRFLLAGAMCFGIVLSVGAVPETLMSQLPRDMLRTAVIVGFLQSNIEIPLSRFIIREDPVRYRTFTFFQFLVTATLAIGFVVGLNMKLWGVLWAYVVSYGVWTAV